MKSQLGNHAQILVIDDEHQLLETIYESIELHFDHVYTASDGIQGLEILKNHSIDAIVTDYMMPVMNGLQFIQKAREAFPVIPIIMLTGNGNNPEIIEAIQLGAFDIMDKPFRAEILVNRILNSLLYPELLKLVWSDMVKTWKAPMIHDFLRLSFQQQYETMHSYLKILQLNNTKSFPAPSKS